MTKPFQPLLAAQTPADLDAFVGGLRYPVLASVKYDGSRVLVRDGTLISRNLKPIKNPHLQQALGSPVFEGLDGELIMGSPTAPGMRQRARTAASAAWHPGLGDITFFVFDWVDPLTSFAGRLKIASATVGSSRARLAPGIFTQMVRHVRVKDASGLLEFEAEALRNGWEGAMIRDPQGVYKEGRSTVKEGILMKLKRFEHDEAEITGAFEQMENTNEATKDERGYTKRSTAKAGKVGKGTLGGFHVKMLEGDFKGKVTKVATGWTDAERGALWAQWQGAPKQLLKRKLVVKYQLAGSADLPSFPVFARWTP